MMLFCRASSRAVAFLIRCTPCILCRTYLIFDQLTAIKEEFPYNILSYFPPSSSSFSSFPFPFIYFSFALYLSYLFFFFFFIFPSSIRLFPFPPFSRFASSSSLHLSPFPLSSTFLPHSPLLFLHPFLFLLPLFPLSFLFLPQSASPFLLPSLLFITHFLFPILPLFSSTINSLHPLPSSFITNFPSPFSPFVNHPPLFPSSFLLQH